MSLLTSDTRLDLETGQETVLTTHKAGVRSLLYNSERCELACVTFPVVLTIASECHSRIMGLLSKSYGPTVRLLSECWAAPQTFLYVTKP